MPKVVITMPAYHAERTLERTVLEIPPGIADELILVDDASRDGTADVARSLGLTVHVHPNNRGYGGNQKSCYQLAIEAGADIVVLLHPDYQYEPKAVPLLIAPILAGDADMTFGSRFAGMGDPLSGGMPLYRYLGNRVTTVAQNLLLGTRFTDMHSGMRAYTRRALQSLPFLGYPDGFSFDAELLVDAVTSGQRVVEVPIPTRYTLESSSISISRSLEYVLHGTCYAARQGLVRGRRGRRYIPGWDRTRRRHLGAPLIAATCDVCGSGRMALRYPRTTDREMVDADFLCTSGALNVHDDIVECPECGLVSSFPPPDPARIIEGYRSAVDPAYLDEEAHRRQLFSWVLDRMQSFDRKGNSVFEIGAHVGLFLSEAERRGWTAAGIEPSSWAVAHGVDAYGVNLTQDTAEDVELKPGAWDSVVMLDVLEHLVSPMAVMRRLRPAIHPRGMLVFATINVEGPHSRIMGKRWPWFTRSHLHYFRPATLVQMLRGAGFEMLEHRVVPRSLHLSYLAKRTRDGGMASRVAEVVDPQIPAGWTGDVSLVIARPRAS